MNGFDDLLDDVMRVCADVFANCTAKLIENDVVLEPGFSGVFDQNHVSVKVIGDNEVSTVGPVLKVHRKDLPKMAEIGDGLLICGTGKQYAIVDVQPDSGFELKLLLHEKD